MRKGIGEFPNVKPISRNKIIFLINFKTVRVAYKTVCYMVENNKKIVIKTKVVLPRETYLLTSHLCNQFIPKKSKEKNCILFFEDCADHFVFVRMARRTNWGNLSIKCRNLTTNFSKAEKQLVVAFDVRLLLETSGTCSRPEV